MRFTLLRGFVVAALLANLVYAAWHAGAFALVGLAPATQREPGRFEQQVRPNAVRVLTPAATASAVTSAASAAAVGPLPPTATAPVAGAASAATTGASAPAATTPGDALACLELGPLEGAALESAERALAAVLPPRAWRVSSGRRRRSTPCSSARSSAAMRRGSAGRSWSS